MKYFTKKLWISFNSSRWKAANRKWDRRFKAYKKYLQTILPGLNPRARQFFRNALILHDGTLIRFEVGDHLAASKVKLRPYEWNDREVAVRLLVLSYADKDLYTIEYRQVTSVHLNFPGSLELFPVGRFPNFGDWGYDELSLSRKGLFRHEIIFSSGATIAIEFRNLTFHRELRQKLKKRQVAPSDEA